jgi:hypothetical protein
MTSPSTTSSSDGELLNIIWSVFPEATLIKVIEKRVMEKSIQFNMKYGTDYKENLINVQTNTNEEMKAILNDPVFVENLIKFGRIREAMEADIPFESETPKVKSGTQAPKRASGPPAKSQSAGPDTPVCAHGPMRKASGGEGDKAWVRYYCQGTDEDDKSLPKSEQCASVAG